MLFHKCQGECTEQNGLWWMYPDEIKSPQLKAWIKDNPNILRNSLVAAERLGPMFALPLIMSMSNLYHKWLEEKIEETQSLNGDSLLEEVRRRMKITS